MKAEYATINAQLKDSIVTLARELAGYVQAERDGLISDYWDARGINAAVIQIKRAGLYYMAGDMREARLMYDDAADELDYLCRD